MSGQVVGVPVAPFRMLTIRSAKGGGFKFDEVIICDIGGRKLARHTSIVFISSWPPFQLN